MAENAPPDRIAALRARFRTRLGEEAQWVREALQSPAPSETLRGKLHRLKGAASMFEHVPVAAAAQAAEEAVQQGDAVLLANALRKLLDCLDATEKS